MTEYCTVDCGTDISAAIKDHLDYVADGLEMTADGIKLERYGV